MNECLSRSLNFLCTPDVQYHLGRHQKGITERTTQLEYTRTIYASTSSVQQLTLKLVMCFCDSHISKSYENGQNDKDN